jgi:hypothetical protein
MKKVVTIPAVDFAMRTLHADDVRKVRALFERLGNCEADEFIRTHSYPLEEVGDTYVLQTTNDIRIFFKVDAQKVTIVDIAKKPAILTTGSSELRSQSWVSTENQPS